MIDFSKSGNRGGPSDIFFLSHLSLQSLDSRSFIFTAEKKMSHVHLYHFHHHLAKYSLTSSQWPPTSERSSGPKSAASPPVATLPQALCLFSQQCSWSVRLIRRHNADQINSKSRWVCDAAVSEIALKKKKKSSYWSSPPIDTHLINDPCFGQ